MYYWSCKRLVDYFAASFARECPDLDIDDIRGEAWLCAVEARKTWNPEMGYAFTTYIFQRFRWLRSHLLVKRYYRREVESDWCRFNKPIQPSSATSLASLCKEVNQKLTRRERKVFDLMINPPEDFREYVRCWWMEKPTGKGGSFDSQSVLNVHYAYWLGCSPSTVHRAERKIGKIIDRIVR